MNENILKRLTKNKSGIISSLDDLEKCIEIFFLKYAFNLSCLKVSLKLADPFHVEK